MLQSIMSTHSQTSLFDDQNCQICSSTSSINDTKRLSCFPCDHCRLTMCSDCYEKHTANLNDEHSQLRKRFSELTNLFNSKRELFATFEEHCIRNINSVFNEILDDLQNLRNESINYVKQQFHDAEVNYFSLINNINNKIISRLLYQI